jgi:hypothetical protein
MVKYNLVRISAKLEIKPIKLYKDLFVGINL